MVTKKRVKKPKSKKKVLRLKSKKKVLRPKPKKVSFSEESFLKTRIKVIGIGGGGSSIVSEIAKSLNKASFVIADTDIRALKKNSGIRHFYFGQSLTHGLGTGMNSELARASAEQEKEKIASLFKDQDISILVASLGGGVGSGATPVFADVARNSGGIILGIFTLPFKFEGGKKSKIAHSSLQRLKDSLNASITIPNERIFKIIDANTPITKAFSVINKSLIESLESLIEMIYNTGLINIDFADIRTTLKGTGKLAFLNTYQAGGKNGADEIIKNIFNNPLYNYSLIAEKILFNISGGSNLSMVDVEKISRSIANVNPKAKIIFGISKNPKSKNKIKATLLVTGYSRFVKPTQAGKKERELKKESKTKGKGDKNKKPKSIKKEKNLKISIKPKITEKNGKIRRNALEIKKAEEIEENKKLAQEKEWEIPTFLRRKKG